MWFVELARKVSSYRLLHRSKLHSTVIIWIIFSKESLFFCSVKRLTGSRRVSPSSSYGKYTQHIQVPSVHPMKAILERISSEVSRGREEFDGRRRLIFGNAEPSSLVTYDEPTVTVTPTLVISEALRHLGQNDSSIAPNGDESENPRHLMLLGEEESSSGRTPEEWSALVERYQNQHKARPEGCAGMIGNTSDTVLHWAVTEKPPIYALKALIAIDPNAVNVMDATGKLPLHVACSHRAAAVVIEELVRCDPETACALDASGFFPLHVLCNVGCSIAALEVLLRSAEGASTVTRKDRVFGRTPLNILNQRKNLVAFSAALKSLRSARNREREAKFCGNWNEVDRTKLATRMKDAKEMNFWCKARLLILAEHASMCGNSTSGSYFGECNGRDTMQACLAVKDFPLSLLEYALLVLNEELSLKDDEGDLPIHKACASSKEHREKEQIIAEILLADPRSAGVKSGDGRSALEIFLFGSTEQPSWSETLLSLILAYPLALGALEFDVRFYPLLLSRLSRMGCDAKTRSRIFEILRRSPEVFVSNTK